MQNSKLDNLAIILPEQKNYEVSYGLAIKLAAERLNDLSDLAEPCRRSGSTCDMPDKSQLISLTYLNRTYQIHLPDVAFSLTDSVEPVEIRDKILILNYFLRAKGTPLSHRLIAYQELQEGSTYYPTFVKRAVKPLIDFFGNTPEKLLDVSAKLGGFPANYGDVAVTIPAFARVPVTLVLWAGDDEFPPNANILFDSTILDYLSAEDINVLCQTISWKLVKMLPES
jgi:Domain of unknown function (DUF3786)